MKKKYLLLFLSSCFLMFFIFDSCVFAQNWISLKNGTFVIDREKVEKRYKYDTWKGKNKPNIFVEEKYFNVLEKDFHLWRDNYAHIDKTMVSYRYYDVTLDEGKIIMEKIVAPSSELAHKYLMGKFSSPTPLPILAPPKFPRGERMSDEIGDVCFYNGTEINNDVRSVKFIRNNMIIFLSGGLQFRKKLWSIAKSIDKNIKNYGVILAEEQTPSVEIILEKETVQQGEEIRVSLRTKNIDLEKSKIKWYEKEGELRKNKEGKVNRFYAWSDGLQSISVIIVDQKGRTAFTKINIMVIPKE